MSLINALDTFLPNLSLLRLDQIGGKASGNKSFKLRENLAAARLLGLQRVVSFGGAWSNHLHALAAIGEEQGFETIGIIRGEADQALTPMLEEAQSWGMKLVHVSRSEYRRRSEPGYREEISKTFYPAFVIPEGGANPLGVKGASGIADLIREAAPDARRILLPVGTGTTLAGLIARLPKDYEVIGISALKGAHDLEEKVQDLLGDSTDAPAWRILHNYHCGGFAKVSEELQAFQLAFEATQSIPLDPIYTAKMLFALQQLKTSGDWNNKIPTLAIHTGGLQGRRGFDWLSD